MNTLLSVSPREALPLIERANAAEAMAGEHPLVFGERAPGRVIAVGEEPGDPRAACAILVRELITPQARVKVGLIGSVATDPDHQGQGLATRVLVEAEAALAMEGCHISLLWANDARFYLSRGYRPIGSEVDLVIPRAVAARLGTTEHVRPMRAGGDAGAIHALYTAHASRVDRAPEETRALLEVPGMSTLVVERDGAVTAYACLGRGHDLQDVIHEWGGELEGVLALIRAHLEARGEPGLFLMAPLAAGALVERLVALGCDASVGVLGLGRVLDHGACAALIQTLLGDAGEAVFHASADGPGVALTCPDGEGFLNDDLILALLFPAHGLDADVDEFHRSFGLERARLPVDLFAWGLDAI